jgi:hypothetical protein
MIHGTTNVKDHFLLLRRTLACLPGGRAVTVQEDSPQYNFSVSFSGRDVRSACQQPLLTFWSCLLYSVFLGQASLFHMH